MIQRVVINKGAADIAVLLGATFARRGLRFVVAEVLEKGADASLAI